MLILPFIEAGRDDQTDRHTHRQTDTQTHKQTYTQTYRRGWYGEGTKQEKNIFPVIFLTIYQAIYIFFYYQNISS